MAETLNRPAAASKAPEIALDPEASGAAGLHVIVTGALGHLRANQPAAESGDVEGVHQIRVAVRRLRSALVLFQPHLEPHAAARFEAELRRVGRVFGEARDWDVFCTETLRRADADFDADVELLLARAAPPRDAGHRRLRAELAGPAYQRLFEGLVEWVDRAQADLAAFGDGKLRRDLPRVAPELLDRLARKTRRRGRHLRARPLDELHALRKSLKKLRYGVDFMSGLYGHKRVHAYRHGCKALQEALGRVNDATAAIRLAETLDDGDRADLAPAVGALTQWAERGRTRALGELPPAWKQFRHANRPWR